MHSALVRSPAYADTWVSLFGRVSDAPAEAPAAALRRSWERCAANGMPRHRRVVFNPVTRSRMSELEDRYAGFVRLARPEIERLASAVVPAGMVVILGDRDGVVLDVAGDLPALGRPLRDAARLGVDLTEQAVGSNALSVAAADEQLNLVGLREHYCDDLRDFFCVAAPICDPQGRRIGILDITSLGFVPRFDPVSLVAQCAIAIENALFLADREHTLLQLHARSDLLDSPLAGLLQVAPDGRVSAANRAAAAMLGMSLADLRARPLGELFSAPLDSLLGTARSPGRDIELRCPSGLALRARAQPSGSAGRAPRVGNDATADTPGRHGGPGRADATVAEDDQSLAAIERRAVGEAIRRHGGNISAAARTLGLSRTTIYRKLAARDPGSDDAAADAAAD
jgi:transcriptional regulator of acetoin/glycerol metabolism